MVIYHWKNLFLMMNLQFVIYFYSLASFLEECCV
nr:MAG TPA: hypothetical protein [Caudoviricetes sp.]